MLTDTTKAVGTSFDQVGEEATLDLEFSNLGTYLLTMDIRATRKADSMVYQDSETYTLHLGPVADLEVRDAGASPVATDQRAYTVMAVNNGPDEAEAVRITGLPTGLTEFTASHGEYDPASGVWTIGRLRVGNYRSSGFAYEDPTLNLITDDAAGAEITAEIGARDYCVRIKTGATGSENDLECTGSLQSGYTEHTAAYFDHAKENNSATIKARAGTGAGVPGAPQSVEAMATRLGNILTWQPVDVLNGFDVTHYEVQRSAMPWETLPKVVAEPMFLDMAASGNPSYRVRAVNIFRIEGPWSRALVAAPRRSPGLDRHHRRQRHADRPGMERPRRRDRRDRERLRRGAFGRRHLDVAGLGAERVDLPPHRPHAVAGGRLAVPGAHGGRRRRREGDERLGDGQRHRRGPEAGRPQGVHRQRRQRHQGQPVLERARRRDPRDPNRL